jgi:hypothetical protein
MPRYAIVNTATNKVDNIVEYDAAPSDPPPGFDANYIAIADDKSSIGWAWDGTALSDPDPPTPVTLPPQPIDGRVFIARVTDAEYAAILTAAQQKLAQGDASMQRWIDTLRLTGTVRLDDPMTIAAKAGLVAAGLLTQNRADVIFGP